jgi:hypothetical protein
MIQLIWCNTISAPPNMPHADRQKKYKDNIKMQTGNNVSGSLYKLIHMPTDALFLLRLHGLLDRQGQCEVLALISHLICIMPLKFFPTFQTSSFPVQRLLCGISSFKFDVCPCRTFQSPFPQWTLLFGPHESALEMLITHYLYHSKLSSSYGHCLSSPLIPLLHCTFF